MKLYLIMGVFLLISCNTNRDNKQEKQAPPQASLQKKLLGKWGAGIGRPTFEIREGDSIYYFTSKQWHTYQLSGDSLYIKFQGSDSFSLFGIMRVREDTLSFTHPREGDHVTWGYRHK